MQLQDRAAELGASDKGVGERGRRCPESRNVLHVSCAGSLIV